MKYLFVSIFFVCSISVGLAQGQTSYQSSTFCFAVSGLEASAKWYSELLGDVQIFSPAEGVVELQLNENTWLQLFEGALATGSIMRLEVDKIQHEYKRVKKLGILPTPIELVPGVVSYFDFEDPDGNFLSFYELETQ